MHVPVAPVHPAGRSRPARRILSAEHRAVAREVALVVLAWLAYFGVRAVTEGRVALAYAHARSVLRLERSLGIAWEAGLQRAALAHDPLVTLANWVYVYGHWPVIAGAAVWLYRCHRPGYRLLRNAMFISGAIGLAIFALYPVAPPRLVPLGLLDSVTAWSHGYRVLQPPALTNAYAAMPSLHLGWDLLVGLMLVRHARRRSVRIVGVVLPVAMAVAIVVTANHFVLDGVAGAALALLGLAVARRLPRGTVQA